MGKAKRRNAAIKKKGPPKGASLGEFMNFYSWEHGKHYGQPADLIRKTGIGSSTLYRWVEKKPQALLALVIGASIMDDEELLRFL